MAEELFPKEVRVTEWSFVYQGSIETVIYAIDMIGMDGRILRMCRDGAAYPYGLLLTNDVGINGL